MSEDTRYNGWSNYETWNLGLWIGNEEGTYKYWREAAEAVYRATPVQANRKGDATLTLATRLKDETIEAAPELESGFYADVLSAAISEVNWYEIAEHWIDDIAEAIDKADRDQQQAENADDTPE